MARAANPAVKRTTIALVILVAVFFFARFILAFILGLISLSMALVQVLAPLLVLFTLGWFVYRVWGKAHFRAWHINRIRNARYLKEAVERGKESSELSPEIPTAKRDGSL
jgi:hypothetical protein